MKKVWVTLLAILFMLGVTGCANNENDVIEADLICESIVSPNEDYIKSDEDKVVL